MEDKKQDGGINNAELVADDPGLTSPPTQIVLESVNPVNPGAVKEGEKLAKEAGQKK